MSNELIDGLCDMATCPSYHGCLSALAEGAFPEEGKKICRMANLDMPSKDRMLEILEMVKL